MMRDQLKKEVKAAAQDGWAVKVGTPMARKFEERRTKQQLLKRKGMIYD